MDMARYAALFLSEAREHLTEVDHALLALERDGMQAEPAVADASFATVFRGVHTIKGMAAAMGYSAVEQLSHALESRCEPLRTGDEAVSAAVLALLFDGTAMLRAAVDAVPDGLTEATDATRAFVQRLCTEPLPQPPSAEVGSVSTATDDEIIGAARAAGEVAHVAVTAGTRTPAQGVARVSDAPRTVRLDARRLDTLLDLVGELVITRDRLVRALEESEHRDRHVVRAATDAARLVTALQEEVLQARMLPAAQVFDRFPRLVRDIAHELGKSVHLTMEGREIELDRSLLDAIGDPIMHLLRNALDHGIEDAETRRSSGKPAVGELVLRAVRDRGAIVIQVQDDGRGIDRDAVLHRAQARGLVDAHVMTLADEALLPLVAHPGLSTASNVTSLSGRGVGVDVVCTRVRALGGQIDLETITGVGTVFTLRLPLTLAIIRALLVQVGGETYAIPAAQVTEVLEFDGSVAGADAPSMTVRDETIALVALEQRFADAPSPLPPAPGNAIRQVVLVELAARRVALLVDAVLAQQDIVVKPLTAVREAQPWFSGATVLGDGSPALIVDVRSVT